MKTNLEKLTELLCTVPEIEKDVKELRFGCKIEFDSWKDFSYILRITNQQEITYYKNVNWFHTIEEQTYTVWMEDIIENRWQYKVIWNTIGYHHLMRYTELNFYWMTISTENNLIIYTENQGHYICEIDNTKDLSEQSEETLGDIYTFLTK